MEGAGYASMQALAQALLVQLAQPLLFGHCPLPLLTILLRSIGKPWVKSGSGAQDPAILVPGQNY